MGDHFVLLVDRLITESTIEAAIESRNKAKIGAIIASSEDLMTKFSPPKNIGGKLVECRICQEEDEDCNMENPCSCCGSLKYAHRKCVQRWCNEKGDTTCEICLQQFKPGYTAPPKLFQYGRIPMNFRGNWEISRRDIQNHRFIRMVAPDHDLAGSSEYDDYSSSSTRSIMYCRSVAIIFMILLLLRPLLPIMFHGAKHYSLALFSLLLLRTAAIVLPLYVLLRALLTFHRRRHQQETHELSMPTADVETVAPRPLHPTPTA